MVNVAMLLPLPVLPQLVASQDRQPQVGHFGTPGLLRGGPKWEVTVRTES